MDEKLKLMKLPDLSEDFVGSGFKIYASECVVVAPEGITQVGVIHCPVKKHKLCYINSVTGLGLSFDVFKEANQDSQINSIHITNKTDKLITVQRGQHLGNLFLVETVNIPGNVIFSNSATLVNKYTSSYFVSSSLNFSSLFLNLGELERKRWLDLLEKWSTVLSMNKYDVGKTDVDYKIRLSETNPIKSYIPRYSQGVRQAILKELEKMKEVDFIEPSISPFAAPMVCVQKGDGSLQVTIDFRMINKNIINDAYPLHRIDDQIDSMRGAAWFTTLDLTKGYHQMNLDIGSVNTWHSPRQWDYINGRSCPWV